MTLQTHSLTHSRSHSGSHSHTHSFTHSINNSGPNSITRSASVWGQSAGLTQDEDAPLVDGDGVRAPALAHGLLWLPAVAGDAVALHGAQLAAPVEPAHRVQVRVQTHQT